MNNDIEKLKQEQKELIAKVCQEIIDIEKSMKNG